LNKVRLKDEIKSLEDKNKKLTDEIENLKGKREAETKEKIERYIVSYYRRTPPSVAKEIARYVFEASEEKKLALPLLLGIIEVESSFNPFAVSKAGARGLMQVMPEWVGKTPTTLEDKHDLHDIKTGIYAGADVLGIHLGENDGDIMKGLLAYVSGDKTYVTKVLTAMGKFISHK
jgi:soluble lytic murein transglycosylase-like protein